MKKLFLLLAVASFSLASMAQDEDVPELKHSVATNSFWSNWFVQGNFTWTAFYSNEEKHADYTKNPIKDMRRDMGLSFAIGKWFMPEIGLRTKLDGFWGKSVLGYEGDLRVGKLTPKEYVGEKQCNHIKYFNVQEQVMLNLSNIISGYDPDRKFEFIPYVGAGMVRNCSYNTYELAASLGALGTIKLADRLKLGLELNYNLCGDDFEGEEAKTWGGHTNSSHDRWFKAEVGVVYDLSKTNGWNRVPDVDALKALHQGQIDALNAQLRDAQGTIDDLRNKLNNLPEPQTTIIDNTVKEFITTPISVFFNLDKTEIAVLKDLVNVRALAKFAKENNRNILVTGYADSATGSVEHNQWLSEKRAERVANELINMGIDPSKITTAAKGGVEILSPIDFNRRATVQITED
ncbi:MAG: OmpA family protein [Prevotella sp.]|nr:OmpA family protein [Prevotella sp.]